MLQQVRQYPDLNVLADPRRLAILQILMQEQASLSGLGQVLGQSPAWVRHHLLQLEAAGFVELAEARRKGGFTEKFYRASARAYWINLALMPPASGRGTVVVFCSDDPALELLAAQLNADPATPDLAAYPVGSLDGLIALRQGLCQLAGCHLYDPVGDEYNTPYVRHLFPGQAVHVVTLAHRQQGLMVPSGNPARVRGLADLDRPELTFINRRPGSGTRIWLDQQLVRLGLEQAHIRGYEREAGTHAQVAQAVAGGQADLGLGVLAAARQQQLDFIPLFEERFDLVVPDEQYRSPQLQPLFDRLHSARFRAAMHDLGGYDAQATGSDTPLH